MNNHSGVGVIDKTAAILFALESGPRTLAELVSDTHLARPTVHRLALALEHHHLVGRNKDGAFTLGERFERLAVAVGEDRLISAAGPVLALLRDETGESAQLFRLQGNERICIAAAERPVGLRDSIPVGTTLTMNAGASARVLLAWEDPQFLRDFLINSHFNAAQLVKVRSQGYSFSSEEREPGVASIAAPIWGTAGKVVAAVSISGPVERFHSESSFATAVMSAAKQLSDTLQKSS